MVLLAAQGESKASIARQLATNRVRMGEWLHRFECDRIQGLIDLPRSGRPIEITSLERHQVIAAACRSPREFGVDRAVWSDESLRNALLSALAFSWPRPQGLGTANAGLLIPPHLR